MTIVGTRPEIIRLSRIISRADEVLDHALVHTGQNYDYELNQVFFDDLSIRKPDIFLNSANGSQGPAETIANVIKGIDTELEKILPDAVLILGDTNSALAALPAKRRKIPIFHMEAGNRCFDQRVPEEINRRIVDHISDINLPYSKIAREYLLREGIPPDQVIRTGSPMAEVLDYYRPQILESTILSELDLVAGEYFIVSAHREENIDDPVNFGKFVSLLQCLAIEKSLPVVVSTHPRTRKKIEVLQDGFPDNVHFLKPLGFFDYIALQTSAKCVLSDSGTITEESSIMKFNALNIRESNERPEGFEEGAVMMVGLDYDLICIALGILENQTKSDLYASKTVEDYVSKNVSEKILKIILSYTPYINKKIWKK